MKLRLIFGTLLILARSVPASAAAGSMSIDDCYQLALARSDEVAISEQEIAVARAIYDQALGSVLPKVSLNASEFLQDSSTNSSDGSVGNTFTRFSRPTVAFTATQNLFQGFKEFRAIKLSKVNESAKRLLYRNAARVLFRDVAISFYTIAKIERDIDTLEKIIRVLRNSSGELVKRVDLGKNRESEVALVQTEVALLEADLEKRRGERKVAYDTMAFLTGLNPQPQISYAEPTRFDLKPRDYYVAMADGRVDVQASRDEVTIAQGEVKIRQGDLLPSADVTANYYPYRTGFQSDIKWDAEFRLGVPVFNWETIGRIREAKGRAKQAELRSELSRRSAVTEIERSYDGYVSSRRQYEKYRAAAAKAQQSYGLQSKDFDLSLINTLDLLQSQQTWLDALRQRNTSEVQVWLDWASLQVNAGIYP